MSTNNNDLTIAMISEHNDPLTPLGGQQAGGQCVYVYELSKALSKLGVKVDVFTRWESRKMEQIVRFAKRAKVIRLKAGPRHFIIKDHFGPLMPEFVEKFLEFAREKKTHYNLIHSNYYFSGWAGLQLKNILKAPMVITFHSLGLIKKKALGERDPSPSERTKIEKQVMDEANKIISTSPQEKKDMLSVYKTDENKIIVIPPGVNLKIFKPMETSTAKKKLNIPQKKKVVVFAGKMERRKGSLTLVAAIQEIKKHWPKIYKDLEVLMLSGDPRKGLKKEKRETADRHNLQEAIHEMSVEDKVKLMPGVEQDVLHDYYGAADVVVMPSYYEPFGMVAIEAMATGTPVVASNVGGLKWSVREGVTGFHAEPKDEKDFAKKIVKILKDPELAERLGKNAIIRARKNFSWPLVTKKVLKAYKNLIFEENGDEDFIIENNNIER